MQSNVINKLVAVFAIVFFLGMLTINGLANSTVIGGRVTGAISDSIPNLFVPAGLTFSIWGVIYLLLLGFVAYLTRGLFGSDEARAARLRPIGVLFIVSCAFNIAWIFAWQFLLIGLSLAIMFALLVTLIAVYLRLRAGRERPRPLAYALLFVPFSVYLGWISVATIANITAALVTVGWNGFGLSEIFWTVLMIGVALALALIVLFIRRDPAYALVFVWAFLGIFIKRSAAGTAFVPEAALVAMIAAGAAIVFVWVMKIVMIARRKPAVS